MSSPLLRSQTCNTAAAWTPFLLPGANVYFHGSSVSVRRRKVFFDRSAGLFQNVWKGLRPAMRPSFPEWGHRFQPAGLFLLHFPRLVAWVAFEIFQPEREINTLFFLTRWLRLPLLAALRKRFAERSFAPGLPCMQIMMEGLLGALFVLTNRFWDREHSGRQVWRSKKEKDTSMWNSRLKTLNQTHNHWSKNKSLSQAGVLKVPKFF